MRAYIANKMTGVPQFNYPWFIDAAAYLRSLGHDIVSPAELDTPEQVEAALASPDGDLATFEAASNSTWGDILAKDVKLIADDGIEAVIVGPDWADSKGAKLETFVAFQLGLPILHYPDLMPVSRETLAIAWLGYGISTPTRISIDASIAGTPIT